MRKVWIQIALPLAFLGLLIGFVYSIYLPYAAEKLLKSTMLDAGFTQVQWQNPQTGRDYVMYENLVLDPEGISTIDTLAVKYSLVDLLIFGRFERIQIQGLSLTGDLDFNADTWLDFSGWQRLNIFSLIEHMPARELNLKQARLSVLTSDFSGVSLTCDLQAKRSGDIIDLQMNLSSAQRALSFTIKGNGRIHKNVINAELEIERGKIEWDRAQIKASRIHGTSTYTQDAVSYSHAGEFEIGGMNFLGMPWQNVGASLEWNDGYLKIIAGGKSVGIDGLELGVDIEKFTDRPASFSGFVHFENLRDFLGYYYQDRFADLSSTDLENLQNIQNLTAYFVAVPTPEKDVFTLTASLEHNEAGSTIKHELPLNLGQEIKATTLFDALMTYQNLKPLSVVAKTDQKP